MTQITTVAEFDKALTDGPYAWPGGYPLFFITSDGAALSFKAAKEQAHQVRDSIETDTNDGWRVVAVDVNWGDAELTCDHTGERIESAYGDAES